MGAGAALYRAEQVVKRQAELELGLEVVAKQLRDMTGPKADLARLEDERRREELSSFMAAMRADQDLNQRAISRVYTAMDRNGFDEFKGE